ncbi:MAG: glycoside hydrolase family 43 protein [Spirochaetia bacterium]|jgi:xylan 1,4-beta-xylosidase|nr:glycoside hydrolase family 43 protein [Spirochaetia bacterium]
MLETDIHAAISSQHTSHAKGLPPMIENPVLKGFNPDPSICYADGCYYIAVSTFEYVPGVAVYESTNLVQWTYCTSILTEPEHLDLAGCNNSSGIYAPTLRFHAGRFYLVTTNKHKKSNFLMTSTSIKGPWSKPMHICETGIDPSLFFDEDGRCFYTSNGMFNGKKGIHGAYLDCSTGTLLEPMQLLTAGVTGCATEAPHIYFRNQWYYLLIAEGGTEYGHHCQVFRSKNLQGPYEEHASAPILSHVHRKGHPIQATGHADLFCTPDGQWFAVFLGVRVFGKALLHNLGRETFLAPVSWIDDWPIIGSQGHVELSYPLLYDTSRQRPELLVDFSRPLAEYPLLKVRLPKSDCYVQIEGNLLLCGEDELGTSLGNPTLLALRQTSFRSTFTCRLSLTDLQGKAGLVAWYNSDYHCKLVVQRISDDCLHISLVRHIHDMEAATNSLLLRCEGTEVTLSCTTDTTSYQFFVGDTLIGSASIASFCSETTMYMSFTGTLLGIFAEQGKATFLSSMSLIDHD